MISKDFFRLPPREAWEYMRGRKTIPPREYYQRIAPRYRQLAFSIAGITALDQIQGVLDDLSRSLATGNTFQDWRRSIQDKPEVASLSTNRLDTIYRTNMQGAYARGQYVRQAEVADSRPYLMYDAINDSRVRESHLACDGFIARMDDPWWKTHRPPMGYRCRCSTIQLTEAQARARGLGKKSRPEVQPDPGWAYDRAQGIEAGVAQSVTNRKMGCAVPPASGIERPAWCETGSIAAAMLARYALGIDAKEMPPFRRAPEPIVGPGESRAALEAAFLAAADAGRDGVIEHGPGLELEVGPDLFLAHDRRGARRSVSTITKPSRAPWVRWIGASIRDPDEAWLDQGEHGPALTLVTRYIEGGRVHGIVATFRRRYDSRPIWKGWGAYHQPNMLRLERERVGVLVYRRP